MGDLVKWGLIGLGAYILYETFAPASATTATATTPVTSAPVSAPVVATPAQQTLALLQAVGPSPVEVAAQAAGSIANSQGQLTPSQWNWYLQQVTGVSVLGSDGGALFATFLPPPANTNAAALVSLSTFFAAALNWAQTVAQQSTAGTATVAPASTGVAGLGDLGYRDAGAHFHQPPAHGDGRFDFADEAW